MTILLDIDGVLETTPSWRQAEIHSDGFMKLNEKALKNSAFARVPRVKRIEEPSGRS